jgi:hypothetical protein
MDVKGDHAHLFLISIPAMFFGWDNANHKEYISQSSVRGISLLFIFIPLFYQKQKSIKIFFVE